MAKRLTAAALLTALALILFTVEAQIPVPAPIPGLKLGLANIITVYAMFRLGPKDTLGILVVRILLGSIFAGTAMTLLFSLCGGLCCYLLMLPLRKLLTPRQLWVCGALGAMAHNLGQSLAAAAVYKTFTVLIYLPVLLLSGILTGLFTGLCAQLLLSRLPGKKEP